MNGTACRGLVARLFGGLLLLACLPSISFGQASIVGLVRDTSGAVLPGVTVEAASPALIQKSRSVVTDATGQYKIVDLRPGIYSVTFTLAGFASVKRDDIELMGSFAASVNVEMRVGAVEETVTVTTNSPIVDVQGITQQRVLGRDVVDTIPSGRYHYNLAVLVPGVVLSNANGRLTQDVGGTVGDIFNTVSIHGGRAADMRVTVDGLTTASGDGSGNATGLVPNPASTQEIALNLSSVPAEQTGGGVQFNIISREGGNAWSGTLFATGANASFQGNNVTQELIDRGLTGRTSIKYNYDINGGVGGRLVRDRLWVYAAARWNGVHNYLANIYRNANAGNPNAWTLVPDQSQQGSWDGDWRSLNGRLTLQASPRNKISFFYDDQDRCLCQDLRVGTSPESAFDFRFPFQRFVTVTWTSPVTNRLLLEAGFSHHGERYRHISPPGSDLSLIPVVEQSSGILYHGPIGSVGTAFDDVLSLVTNARASLAYVTGTHAFKVGFTSKYASRDALFTDNLSHLNYRLNAGTPNQLTMRATPWEVIEQIAPEVGIYAQDQWVFRKLTMNVGVRYDYFNIGYPDQTLGPAFWVPTRNLSFPAQAFVRWHDVTPRLGAAYDLFGNGKTALKITLNKYLVNQGLAGIYGDGGNPVLRLANTITRNWTDFNRNFIPDCDLINPLGNNECGPMSDRNFGNPTPNVNYDPATITGWNARPNDWEVSASVQHELTARVAVNVGYFRRWYGNFTVTDNLATAPTDFSVFSIPAPVDPRLPDGGGYTISGLYNLNPDKVGQVNNYLTLAENFGKQIEHWNGIDASINARLGSGIFVQGGVSTGRTVTDNCDVVAKVDNPSLLYCHQDSGFLTQIKGYGAYTFPKDIQLSASYQGLPGPVIAANYNAPNSVVQPSLGRPLSGGAANVTVNIVEPGTMYGDWLNQMDFRVSKGFRIDKLRLRLNGDLYNALNGSPVMQENPNYATWRVPQVMQQARIAKVSVQIDY